MHCPMCGSERMRWAEWLPGDPGKVWAQCRMCGSTFQADMTGNTDEEVGR